MTFGYVVLYGWPLVVAALFRFCNRQTAFVTALIAGYLLLPTRLSYDLPALPPLDKETVPSFAALLAVLLTRPSATIAERPGWVPKARAVQILLLVLVVGAFMTVMTNRDPLSYGDTFLPALRPYDAFSSILAALVMLIPFILGRKLLADPAAQRLFLKALLIGAFCYSFLALYEVRMSPQLNNMVYGFFPHAWDQHVRGGGFRPLVFLRHGLWLGIFFSAAILAAAGLARMAKEKEKAPFGAAVIWMLGTLILSKTLGALAITLLSLPVVLLLKVRTQILIAAIVSGIVLVYPMLRSADLVPVDQVQSWAESVDPERGESFGFRLINEDILLGKAMERPLLGWGGWGRNHGYNELGIPETTVDGYWVGILGVGGWAKYIAEFGILCLPAIFLFLLARRYKVGLETAVLAMILAGNVVDLIPNATVTPITWMIAGAIWGRIELGDLRRQEASETQMEPAGLRRSAAGYRKSEEAPSPNTRNANPYTRQQQPKQRRKTRQDRGRK